MKRKTILLTIISILIIVFLTLLLKFMPVIHFAYAQNWDCQADHFLDYEEDIKKLTEYFKEKFETEGLIDSRDNGSKWLDYYYNQKSKKYILFSSNYDTEIPKDIEKYIQSLESAFPQRVTITVNYYDNQISYTCQHGDYSLIYSFNDKKPSFMVSPDETERLIVKKIKPNWYHVATK